MVRGSRVVVLLSLVVVCLSAAAPTGAATTTVEADIPTGVSQPQGDTDAGVTQTFVVDLQQDGDARWTVTKTFNLTSRNETAAFDGIADSFQAGETDDLGLASYRRASELANESTGREMAIRNVSRRTDRTGTATNGTGTLSVSFTWTNFGRPDGEKFYIDDVFATGSGPWFDGLYATQKLVIQPPEGYNVFDASAPVQSGTIQWTGPQEFTAETLSATFERTGNVDPGGTATPTPGPEDTASPTAGTPIDGESGSLLWAGLLTLGLGAVVVGYLLVRDREGLELPGSDGTGEPTGPGSDDGPGGATTASAGGATTDEVVPEVTGETAGDPDDDDDGIDVELLSDEERVERLLERNGGRMKQANIVKETNWSNAKVSQLLSAMEEEGQIDKLRIGRENLISFPDEDITDFEE